MLGKLHASTCSSYEKIASIFRDAGDFESAIFFYSKVLAIRESHLGKEAAETVQSYNDLMNATAQQMAAEVGDTAPRAPLYDKRSNDQAQQ